MTTPIEQLSFKPTGASIAKTLGDYAAEVINVKDYGARGDGTATPTSDTAAIQRAFNAAFGMAQLTGSISATTPPVLTVTSIVGTLEVGMAISASSGISYQSTPNIASFGTGTGGLGTYNLTGSSLGTISSRTMMACRGQGSFAKKKVRIPAGNYIVDAPLYIIGVLGAHVYGDGNGPSQLFFQTGNPSQGNVINDGGSSGNHNYTPVLCLDGVAYSKIEMLSLEGLAANNETSKFVGIMAYQSGAVGPTSAIIFENMNISDFWTGLVGVQGNGNVENCILTNVQFNTCGLNGVQLTGGNVVNWNVFGGGAANCSWLNSFLLGAGTGTVGAGYNLGVGAIGCLYGISCTGNVYDVFNNGGQQCHVAGSSFEGGPAFDQGTLTWNSGTGLATFTTNNAYPHKMITGTNIIIYGAAVHTGYNGRFVGTVTSPTTITYPISNPGGSDSGAVLARADSATIASAGSTVTVSGCFFRGGSSAYILPIYIQSGTAIVTGGQFGPGHADAGGYISWLTNGVLLLDGVLIDQYDTSSFKIQSGSELFMRGCIYGGVPANAFSQASGGFVREYDYFTAARGATFATLPAASAIFTGLRGSITDSSVTTFLGNAAGGGANIVPVFCDGTHWKIG